MSKTAEQVKYKLRKMILNDCARVLPYLNLEGLLNSIDTTSNKLQDYIQDVSLFSGDELSNLVKANDHLMKITAFKLKLFDYVFDLINKEVKAQEYQKEVERDPLGL